MIAKSKYITGVLSWAGFSAPCGDFMVHDVLRKAYKSFRRRNYATRITDGAGKTVGRTLSAEFKNGGWTITAKITDPKTQKLLQGLMVKPTIPRKSCIPLGGL